MPHFSASGHDEVLCQKCGRVVDTGKESVEWRPDITGHQSAGNVCAPCVRRYLNAVADCCEPQRYRDCDGTRRQDGPLSLYEHCKEESGLSGAALDRYIQRYYGHG